MVDIVVWNRSEINKQTNDFDFVMAEQATRNLVEH